MNKVLFIYTSGRERLIDGRQAAVLQKLKRGHIQGEDEKPPTSHAEGKQEDDLRSLRKEATRLGIEVDGRWGEKRIKKEIASHVAVQDDD